MTVLAKDAVPGKIYRLTREPGTTYYKICEPAAVARLRRRLEKLNPRTMRPDDLRTWQALVLCQAGYGKSRGDHVLALRILRFRDDRGSPRETRAYVAFPADYALREVEKPPGYAGGRNPSTASARGRKIHGRTDDNAR